MALYEYLCESCNNSFEVRHPMSQEPLKTCPDTVCSGPVKRVMSAPAHINFVGSGFYRNDSAKKKDTASKEA